MMVRIQLDLLWTARVVSQDGIKYARSIGSLGISHASQSDLVVLVPKVSCSSELNKDVEDTHGSKPI